VKGVNVDKKIMLDSNHQIDSVRKLARQENIGSEAATSSASDW